MNTQYTNHGNDSIIVTEPSVKREAGNNISWGAIFAGLITFIALSIVFSLIGTAIGLGMTDLTSSNPLKGVGLSVVLWTIFSLIVTLAAGGFVAGVTANRAGYIHGFLSWAVGLITIVFLATSALGTAFNVAGNVLGFAGKQVTNVVGASGNAVANLTESAFTEISNNLTIDMNELEGDVRKVLKDSNIPQLQPNYLQGQLDATVKDIQNGARAIVIDGKPAEQVFKGVYSNIENRVAKIGEGLNEKDLKAAIAQNSNLTPAEVDAAYNNIKNSYEKAKVNAQKALNDAEKQLKELAVKAEKTAENVVSSTNDALNATSKYAIYAFIGLVIAAVLTSYAGYYGSQKGFFAKFL